jgi:hypothetical protein
MFPVAKCLKTKYRLNTASMAWKNVPVACRMLGVRWCYDLAGTLGVKGDKISHEMLTNFWSNYGPVICPQCSSVRSGESSVPLRFYALPQGIGLSRRCPSPKVALTIAQWAMRNARFRTCTKQVLLAVGDDDSLALHEINFSMSSPCCATLRLC